VIINLGIIGYGYWGPNIVRNFFSTRNCTIKMVADIRQERVNVLNKNYPEIVSVTNPYELINSPVIDAVVIATPVSTHYTLAKHALLNGKHILIEKPMTSSQDEAKELIDIATQKGLLIMVDHTYLYTGAVNKIKELIGGGTLGKEMHYFDSTRINLGLFQQDINVLWDLAPHDISVLNFLFAERPMSVNARGVAHTQNGMENIAYLTLNYNSGFIAHFNCSWSSPVKIRMTLIGGDEKLILYNDLEPTEKVKIYNTGYQYMTDEDKNNILVDYRMGDIFIPKLNNTEALYNMANDFVESILNNKLPVSNTQIGLDVVKILEASNKSLKNNGKEILVSL
jgi:predicted dehydrogenase